MNLHQVDDIDPQVIERALDALAGGLGGFFIGLGGNDSFIAAPLESETQDTLGLPVTRRGIKKIDAPVQGFVNDPDTNVLVFPCSGSKGLRGA